MKTKDIKKMFLEEDEQIKIKMSPKLLDTPIETKTIFVAEPQQKRKITKKMILAPVLSLVLILVIGISIFIPKATTTTASALTAYVLEINPSISITTNRDNEIVNICALNEDADQILSDSSFDNIVGETLNIAVNNIINVAKGKGYLDNYHDNIKLWTLNDDADKMKDNLDKFGDMVRRSLDESGFENIDFEKHEMALDDFKQKMGFEGDYNRLDDMQRDIQRHDKFKGDVPPKPRENELPDGYQKQN